MTTSDLALSKDLMERIYLFGFMPMFEATGALMSDLGHNFQIDELKEKWLTKTENARRLAESDPYIVTDENIKSVVRDCEPELRSKVNGINAKLRNYRMWRSVNFEIKLVEIDKLIALQGNISLERVNWAAEKIPSSPRVEQLLDLSFNFNRVPAKIDSHLVGQSAYIFSSDDEDMRLGPPEMRLLPKYDDTAGADSELVPSFVTNVFRGDPFVHVVQTFIAENTPRGPMKRYQLTLQNGFHRAYALKSMGVTHIPCIVVAPTSSNETAIFSTSWSAERQQQVTYPRPPLMKDFFNPDVSEKLAVQKRKTCWKISWEVEHLMV